MGRSGGGGGYSGGGHHSSSGHHSSGHVSSSRSSYSSSSHSSSSSRTSYSSSRPSYGGPRPGYGGPRPGYGGPRPGYGGPRHGFGGPRFGYSRNNTTVYVNNGGSNDQNFNPHQNGAQGGSGGCGTWLLIGIIVVIIAMIIGGIMQSNSGAPHYDTDMDRIYAYAEQQYTEQFGNRNDAMIFVIDEDDAGEAVWGSEAAKIIDQYDSTLWNAYDMAYNEDLGIQWNAALTSTAAVIAANGETAIKPEAKFDSRCYRDDLGWVDTPNNLVQGAETFYDVTGVQVFIIHTKYSTIENATSGPNYTGAALMVGLVIVLIMYIISRFITTRKEQKIKELEETNKILNTPLEKYSDTASDLASKYEDKE